ncbi:MAG: hypothetical protein HC788_01015 [Sphingopyxis sp.]|nr:hypothetical protein [Sphingopyxis sp.]
MKLVSERLKISCAIILSIALSTPAQANSSTGGFEWICSVSKEDAEGEWDASRSVFEAAGTVTRSRDSFGWQPKTHIEFEPGMRLKWAVRYYWPADLPTKAPLHEDDVFVSLDYWFDAQKIGRALEKPERSWIHFYRSTDADRTQTVSEASMTSIMVWHRHNNGNMSTKAVVPVKALLAFGSGYDQIVWNIRSAPNEFGGTRVLAKGILPIAAMRDKISEIQKLRRQLDKKTAKFRTQCDVPRMAPVTVAQ